MNCCCCRKKHKIKFYVLCHEIREWEREFDMSGMGKEMETNGYLLWVSGVF